MQYTIHNTYKLHTDSLASAAVALCIRFEGEDESAEEPVCDLFKGEDAWSDPTPSEDKNLGLARGELRRLVNSTLDVCY